MGLTRGVGVDNGVTYYYRVQANGGGACFAVSAGGAQSISIGQPEPSLNNVIINDSNGGNGDQNLDAGEQATIFIGVRNAGLGAMTNVSGTLRSLTPGILVTTGATSYGSIAVNGVAGPAQSFGIAIDSIGALCGTTAQLVLDMTSDQGCFAVPVSLLLDGSNCQAFANAYARPQSIVQQ